MTALALAEMPVDTPVGRRPRVVSVPLMLALCIAAAFVVLAIGGAAIAPNDPTIQSLSTRLQAPVGFGGSWSHPLGTDTLGRDLVSRVMAGARASLLVALVTTLGAGLVGVLLGLLAGGLGGLFDSLVSFATEVQAALPFIVVAIAMVAVLGNGFWRVVAVLILTGWVSYARIVRLQARSLRHAPYIDAARIIGASRSRLLFRHLLPNIAAPVVIVASQQIGAVILYEAALSYLGLGLPSSILTWGRLVADGNAVLLNAWWVALIPGCAIALTVLALQVIGDALAQSRWLSRSTL